MLSLTSTSTPTSFVNINVNTYSNQWRIRHYTTNISSYWHIRYYTINVNNYIFLIAFKVCKYIGVYVYRLIHVYTTTFSAIKHLGAAVDLVLGYQRGQSGDIAKGMSVEGAKGAGIVCTPLIRAPRSVAPPLPSQCPHCVRLTLLYAYCKRALACERALSAPPPPSGQVRARDGDRKWPLFCPHTRSLECEN